MTSPETSITLAPDVQRNDQQHDKSGDSGKRAKHLHGPARHDPVVDIVRHAVEEEILEGHGHDEDLVAQITESVEDVSAGGDRTDENSKEHDRVDDRCDGRIPVFLETVAVESETQDREDEGEEHGEQSEFRFVDTLVSVCAEFDDGIGNDGHEDRGKETTDCGTDGKISDVGGRVEVWWGGEPLGHDE